MIPEQLENIPDIKKYDSSARLWGYVYFIISEGKVIYVGQTAIDISVRLSQFRKEKTKEYDQIYYIVRRSEDLADIEKYYINHFKPCWNTHGKKDPISADRSQ